MATDAKVAEIESMGFVNRQLILTVLNATNGRVDHAVELLIADADVNAEMYAGRVLHITPTSANCSHAVSGSSAGSCASTDAAADSDTNLHRRRRRRHLLCALVLQATT